MKTIACIAAAFGFSAVLFGQEPAAKKFDPETSAREFVKLLAKNDFSAASKDFDKTMKKVLPAKKLEEVWKKVLSQIGPFEKIASLKKERVDKYDVVLVTCAFAEATLDAKVIFNAERQIVGLFFVPTPVAYKAPAYVKADSFRDVDVTIGSEKWKLPGTISLPAGPGPFPAVVLVHGSGAHDRDETIGPNKPFRDLAWGLASRGIAVLRYEKRGKMFPKKMAELKDKITINDDVIDDALAAVKALRGRDKIDDKKIFLLGHSLGGTLAPRLAHNDKEISGLVILAGATRPLEDHILKQFAYIYALEGKLTDEQKANLEKLKKQAERVRDPKLSGAVPASDLPLGVPASYWLSLRGAAPPELAKKLDRPMLILQGERDYQVTMRDFQAWKKALAERKNVTLKSYPQLNHLFMEGKGKSRPEEYQKAGHVAAAVIDDIAAWLKK